MSEQDPPTLPEPGAAGRRVPRWVIVLAVAIVLLWAVLLSLLF